MSSSIRPSELQHLHLLSSQRTVLNMDHRLSTTGGSGQEGEGDRTSGDGWEARSLPPALPGPPMTACPADGGPAH